MYAFEKPTTFAFLMLIRSFKTYPVMIIRWLRCGVSLVRTPIRNNKHSLDSLMTDTTLVYFNCLLMLTYVRKKSFVCRVKKLVMVNPWTLNYFDRRDITYYVIMSLICSDFLGYLPVCFTQVGQMSVSDISALYLFLWVVNCYDKER